MPPVTKADSSTLRKDVDFVAKDAAEQQATGIVMVPYAVDLHGDWERPETIEEFADQFGDFEEVGQADGGVMHAVWPDEHIALERNEVVDEATSINGADVPAGAWVQTWEFADDELWSLVEDGVLEGYSIGAINVDWDGPTPQDELPDEVSVPDEFPDEEMAWELTDGLIREVSAVDIPAVPDAQILETKAEAEKRLADHLGNRDGFIEEAMDRGHSEAEAERLWEYLNRAVDIEGAGNPGEKSRFANIGRTVVDAVFGKDSADTGGDKASDATAAKAGRTLSKQNRDSAMAAIDANLDMLEDAGVDHGMTRFTDQDDVAFDLSEHDAREWAGDHDDDGEDEDDGAGMDDVSADKNAPDGDTSDDTTDMSDSDDPWDDAPEWAKDLRDTTQENSQRIDDLADNGDADKDADTDGGDVWDDAPEWAKALAKEQEKNAERIDTIATQSGFSDQLGKSGSDDDGEESGLDTLGKALS